MTTTPFTLKPGPSLRILENPDPATSPEDLFGHLLIWEQPRAGHRYVISGDVAEGVDQDRSVATVLRVDTLAEPAEEVAQFVSPLITPHDFAYVVDQAGRLYVDGEGQEALAAVECNGHGIATQAELQRHLGYNNLFRWQYYDADSMKRSYSHKLGWWTNTRTRPLIVTNLLESLARIDPVSGSPDVVVRSPITMEELRSLYVAPGYPTWMASAAAGAHDDCVLALAIAAWVARAEFGQERESVADTRRRQAQEKANRERTEAVRGRFDFQNTDATTADMALARGEDPQDEQDYGYAGY